MRLAFVTMVWRDYWLLAKWIEHNSAVVAKSQLYVINHGGDPEIERIANGCNVINIPRDDVSIDLTERRWQLLSGVTNGLQAFFDLVVCTDVDELLVYTGSKANLLVHLAERPIETDALCAIGLNLIPSEAGVTSDTRTVLEQHPNAMLSAKYSKPCISKKPVAYTIGGHGIFEGTFDLDPEILLFHLHYVTPDYIERMTARRDIVVESRKKNDASDDPVDVGNRFWINWANPHVIRRKEFAHFDTAVEVDVSNGFEECATILNSARSRSPYKMLINPKWMDATPRRIVVPENLRGLL